MSKQDTIYTIKNDIITTFLQTYEDSTVKEISERTGISEATIRKYTDDLVLEYGMICTEKELPIYSKSYKNEVLRTILVTAYGPSRKTLANSLRRLTMGA